MADIELSILTYEKPEIDQKITELTNHVDSADALKLDAIQKGQPDGVAQLDTAGKAIPTNLPMASFANADDKTNSVTVITPEMAHYLLDKLEVKIAALEARVTALENP